MDARERFHNPLVQIRAAIRQADADHWSCLPGIVSGTFNAAKRICDVQPTLQVKIFAADGSSQLVNMAVSPDCPVVFPGNSKGLLTFPLTAGDEGILVFADRCIDAWWQNGGIQPQAEIRIHDRSDGFFIPGVNSVPNVAPSISTSTCQFRSFDGTTYFEIANGQIINIVAPGGINLTGSLHVSGDVIAGFGGADQVNVRTHKHTGVTAGGAQTSSPVAGT
jgi:hypothetical protein